MAGVKALRALLKTQKEKVKKLQEQYKDKDSLKGTAAQKAKEQEKQKEGIQKAKDKVKETQAKIKDEKAKPDSPQMDKPKKSTKEEAPKKQVKQPRVSQLDRRAAEKQRREKDAPQAAALAKAGDALRARPKKNFDPTKTPEEAGRGAARMAGAFRAQEQKGMQGAYNRLKGEVEYLRKNDPSSSFIAGKLAEMKRLRQRGNIDTKQSVKARVPAEVKSDVRAKRKDKELDADVAKIMEALNKRKPQGKARGGVVKKRIGAHDFRMNKGGLLLSSVDNRKRK